MNRQCLLLAAEQQRWVMGLVETAGRAHCYPAPEEWDSWKSPRTAVPQTELCWLSSEATWRHGERPADSWRTGRCHGNWGSSRMTPGRPKVGRQSCYESRRANGSESGLWWKILMCTLKTFPCINNCKKRLSLKVRLHTDEWIHQSRTGWMQKGFRKYVKSNYVKITPCLVLQVYHVTKHK